MTRRIRRRSSADRVEVLQLLPPPRRPVLPSPAPVDPTPAPPVEDQLAAIAKELARPFI